MEQFVKKLDELDKIIRGESGNNGLNGRVIRMEEKIVHQGRTLEQMNEVLDKKLTLVSSLEKYMNIEEARNEWDNNRIKERKKERNFRIVQTIAIISIMITTLIYMHTIFRENKQPKKTSNYEHRINP